jgi:dTDP-4-dehydrorhamnose 3,5-epimerase
MSNERFSFSETSLSDLYKVDRKILSDDRGFFSRFFCANEFGKYGFTQPIAQINHSHTRSKGTIRGLHFQNPPHSEVKVVSCIKGEIFDVVVDIRKNSPTFLRWHAEILNEESQSALLIPEGFAHGFQTLTHNCEMMYLHSQFYNPSSESGLNIKDPTININWPLQIAELSARDNSHALLDQSFKGISQ